MAEEKTKDENKEHFYYYHHNKLLIIILAFIALIVIIGGAVLVGGFALHFKRMSLNQNWAAYPHRNFGGYMMRGGHWGFQRGLSGQVTKIEGDKVTVKSNRNNQEYTAIVSNSTSFSKQGNIAKQSDLKVDDQVVVMGASDSQGQINASAIIIK